MTIKASIRMLFGILVIVFCGFAYFTMDRMSVVNNQSTVIAEKWMPRAVTLQAIDAAFSNYRVVEARHIISTDATMISQADKDLVYRADIINKIREQYIHLQRDETESQDFVSDFASIDNYMAQNRKMLEFSRENRNTEALDEFLNSKAAYDEVRLKLEQLANVDMAAGNTASDNGDAIYAAIVKMTLAIGAVIVLASVGAAVFFDKRVASVMVRLADQMKTLAGGDLGITIEGQTRADEVGTMAKAVQIFKDNALKLRQSEQEARQTREAQAAQRDRQSAIDNAKAEDLKVFVHAVEAGFDALSAGDLTVRMNQAVSPEFEPIRAKFNESIAALEETIGTVVSAVGTMRVGLGEITVAAADLSQRTEQQAASLEQTVAALADVTRGINGTASDAMRAQTTAAAALKNAEKGGTVVAEAVAAMSQIEQSSDKIGKIIGVIDEIAFQTNLLALNAGVEAARAGEAGRGFAVVAQEVRGLAQRSAEAAKEIKSLIATSSAQVGHGVELVTASGKSLEGIVSQVAEMSEVVSGIARSSSEQSLSLKEVSTAADQMDKVTQQNAAMVEETTAAAQSLLGETDDLATLIQRFRTSQSGARTSSARAPAQKPTTSAHRPVAQMRATGSGGAAPKAAPASDEWAEF